MPIDSGTGAAAAASATAAAAAASTAAAAKDAAAPPAPSQGALLPHEVLVRIFELLPARELAVTPGRVCRAWAAAKAEMWKGVAAATEALRDPQARAYPLLPSWYARSLFSDDLFRYKDRLVNAAARHGQLDLLAHYYEIGRPYFTSLACQAAAKGANLDTLKWLRARGVEWDEDVTIAAACSGDLSVLRWCVESGCEWIDEYCLFAAAANGYLEMVDWIVTQQGCEWTQEACALAASSGHLHVLQHAHEKGLEMDGYTCSEACAGGHLAVLKFCVEQNAPIDVKECVKAALRGRHQECYEWLVANVPGASRVKVEDEVDDGFPLVPPGLH
jgi:hypothetical protein